jgi:hypothetical protein
MEELVMDKNLVEIKDIQKLEIPLLSMFVDPNVPVDSGMFFNQYKIERTKVYSKHKLSKILKKEVRT